MGKFFGKVGYVDEIETAPGVYEPKVVERDYYGDLIKNYRRLDNTGQVNDNVNIANDISIVADQFAYDNFHKMRYVEFMGSKWKVNSVEVNYPRLILQIGGLYNGETESGTSECSGGCTW